MALWLIFSPVGGRLINLKYDRHFLHVPPFELSINRMAGLPEKYISSEMTDSVTNSVPHKMHTRDLRLFLKVLS